MILQALKNEKSEFERILYELMWKLFFDIFQCDVTQVIQIP
jgi:hypothetical protein